MTALSDTIESVSVEHDNCKLESGARLYLEKGGAAKLVGLEGSFFVCQAEEATSKTGNTYYKTTSDKVKILTKAKRQPKISSANTGMIIGHAITNAVNICIAKDTIDADSIERAAKLVLEVNLRMQEKGI